MIPALSDMREPPVVGRFYMVPTVHYYLHGLTTYWPVLGPIHDDAEDLDFPHLHFHLDGRFLSKRMRSSLRNYRRLEDDTLLNGTVLIEVREEYRKQYGELPRQPVLRRRKCRRADIPYTAEAREKILESRGNKIEVRHGFPAEPIRLRDGRILCPHRKVDLSTFAPDADGLVTCPLHGLRVHCGAPA